MNKAVSIKDEFKSIADIFIKAMTRYPKRPALVIEGQTWSYEELGCLIIDAASQLRMAASDAEDRIAIIGANHIAYIVTWWAAQFIGCSTIEIDRNESLETLLGILSKTNPRFVATDRDDLKSAIHKNIPVKLFRKFLTKCDKDQTTLMGLPGKLPFEKWQFTRQSHKSEVVVYTSGTTASAKGIILSQRNLCFIASTVAGYLGLNETDRCALILPLSHTYGKSVLLSAAAVGATIVMLDSFGNRHSFLSQLTTEKCTVLSAVPYHLHALVKSGCLRQYNLSSLKTITSSADKLSPSTIEGLTEALPWIRIFSMYGLTEAASRVCFVPPEMIHQKKKSCGRPLPGVELKIVAKDGRDAAVGEIGEVLLRGPNIMTGYLDNPDLTTETIVAGWLKTGDLGHLDADGFLYIDGRKKDLIKCAGERVNPLEIEEILMKYPDVEDAAVVGRPDSLMGEIIHAYVVSGNSPLNKADLHEHCSKRLSRNKVPYKYTIVDRLPVTSTGKVRKHFLGDTPYELTIHG